MKPFFEVLGYLCSFYFAEELCDQPIASDLPGKLIVRRAGKDITFLAVDELGNHIRVSLVASNMQRSPVLGSPWEAKVKLIHFETFQDLV